MNLGLSTNTISLISFVAVDSGVTNRTDTGKPVQSFPALGAAPGSFLLFYPSFNPVFLHILQVVNDMSMVRNAINNVDFGEIPQPLAGKVRALKTPGHFFLFGTTAEAVPTLQAEGYYPVREAAITANFFDGYVVFSGNFG
jgi:hypothetical protein